MLCKKCGKEIKNGATFCSECGTTVENISKENKNSTDTNNLFFSPDEREVAVLGSSFLMNYISAGNISNGSCVLSDKRVYFKGKCYSREGGRLIKTAEESTVDIKDITASGFSYSSKAGIFVLGCFFCDTYFYYDDSFFNVRRFLLYLFTCLNSNVYCVFFN